MVLQGAEVEHLVAAADVRGAEAAAPSRAGERRVGAEPRVASTERDGEAGEPPVRADGARLVRELPCTLAEGLQADIGESGSLGDLELGDRDHQVLGCGGGAGHERRPAVGEQAPARLDEELDHRRTRPAPHSHDRAREDREACVAGRHVHDDDRIGEIGAVRHVDDDRVEEERVVEQREVRGVGGGVPEQRGSVGLLGEPPEREHPLGLRRVDRGEDAVDGHDEARAGTEAAHQRMDPLRR